MDSIKDSSITGSCGSPYSSLGNSVPFTHQTKDFSIKGKVQEENVALSVECTTVLTPPNYKYFPREKNMLSSTTTTLH